MTRPLMKEHSNVDVQPGEFFEFNVRPSRGHQYKLYKNELFHACGQPFLVNVL